MGVNEDEDESRFGPVESDFELECELNPKLERVSDYLILKAISI